MCRWISAVLVLVISFVHLSQSQGARAGKGIQLAYIDSSVSPCDDFYQFANGKWFASTEIPADRSSWGSGSELYERNLTVIHGILDDAAGDTKARPGSIKRKVGDFYRLGMDSAAIEAQGLTPLSKEFGRINMVTNRPELLDLLGHLHRINVNAAFGFFVYMDFKNVSQNIAQLYQGGLGLPNRDYYTKTDEASEKLKKQYVEHVAKMFMLLGDPSDDASRHAATVMSMETRLAQASMTPVEERDPNAIYHKMTLSELDALVPGIPWHRYFVSLGLDQVPDINVAQPTFFKEVGTMIREVPLDDWKTYLRWQLIAAEAPRLADAFVKEDFRFNGTIVRGTKELQPRWKRMYEAVDKEMGELLGQMFVERAFGPQAKERARMMVLNLKAALHDRIMTLSWITENTRKQALEKLDATAIKIGYPDKWRDYSALKIDAPTFVENAIEADEFETQRNLNKIGKPVDRTEWGMTPTTVDAYYNPNYNEIVFPAAILQPPFFDVNADDATLYGGIGTIIGHELTHGFDDQGRQFDAEGNLKDWWTPQDEKNYDARAAVVEKQFDNYVAIDTLHINGKLTLGENIADLGGVKISYLAFTKSLEGKPHPAPIDGYTAEQRFFLAYAQTWKRLTRPESVKLMLSSDPHSPPRFRVMGPLYNLPEFDEAFGCKSGKMVNTTQRAEIW